MIFKKKAQRYSITTLQDICQLDPSQLDEFFTDLKTWVLTTKGMQEAFKLIGFPELPPNMMGMVWIDDGKHEYGGVKVTGGENAQPDNGGIPQSETDGGDEQRFAEPSQPDTEATDGVQQDGLRQGDGDGSNS